MVEWFYLEEGLTDEHVAWSFLSRIPFLYFLNIALSVNTTVYPTNISNTTPYMIARMVDIRRIGIEKERTLFHVVNFFGGSSKYGEPGIFIPQKEVRHAP